MTARRTDMDTLTEQQRQGEVPRQEGVRPLLALATGLVILAGVTLAIFFPPIEGPRTGIPASRKVSTLSYPAQVVSEFAQPSSGQWLLPASLTRVGDATFVLDTGHKRIFKLDDSGQVVGTIEEGASGDVPLQQPMAIASDGERLFVADSLAGRVVVMSAAGIRERVIELAPAPGELRPRPIGIAVNSNGEIIVSDADNHRVLFLDSEGRLTKSVGTGTRAGGTDGFNVPAGLAVDAARNVFVVDTLNGRVVKLSPDGAFLAEFGRLADTAGSLARPKAVAVDAAGRVFVSDGLQAAIEVFAPDGAYLGVIGRRDSEDAAAGSLFQAPSGLALSGDRLDVIDGVAGWITLRLSEPPAATAANTSP
jgi:DNA-binding beta-propeller fold protein YncE